VSQNAQCNSEKNRPEVCESHHVHSPAKSLKAKLKLSL